MINFFADALGWLFRGVAFFVGRERVVGWMIRTAEKQGCPEIAAHIRDEYFKAYGKVIR